MTMKVEVLSKSCSEYRLWSDEVIYEALIEVKGFKNRVRP